MKKWEYLVDYIVREELTSLGDMRDYLSKKGEKRWELVSIREHRYIDTSASEPDAQTFIFKRKK